MHVRRLVPWFAAAFVVAIAWGTPARAARVPDFTGTWRLDAGRSDIRPGEGARRFSGGPGNPGAPGRPGGPGDRGRSGGRTAALPEVIHITQTQSLVSFEDTTGVVLQEITMLGGARDTLAHAPGAPVVKGAWKDQALQVTREGRRGAMQQTFTLEQNGRLLVVRNVFTGGPDGARREFKRVYTRSPE